MEPCMIGAEPHLDLVDQVTSRSTFIMTPLPYDLRPDMKVICTADSTWLHQLTSGTFILPIRQS